MNKTVKLLLDGKKIYAEENTTILEAARQNDIYIPTLCYHSRLEPLGHCRLCIVNVEGIDRPVTSCDNPVTDGMIVNTSTEQIIEMRRAIVELTLSTHPYKDCLTCVRTGTCELQDNAYELQSNLPGQLERDIPAEDEKANPYLVRDEEKCILCGRCIQVCRTGAGCFVYEMIGTGVNTRVVPYRDGREVSLEEAGCIYCGQCIDVCPVAALTEKDRNRGGREWDLKAAQGVCNKCSLGCYLERQVYGEEVIKVTVPAEGEKVSWLCKKGKYGHQNENGQNKLYDYMKLSRKKGSYVKTDRENALQEAAQSILALKDKYGAESLAVLASGQLSVEENYLLQKLARDVLGTANVDLGAEPAWINIYNGMMEVTGSEVGGPSPAELSRAESITVIGNGLEESHPVADMAIGRAGRFGEAVIVRVLAEKNVSSAWQEFNFNLKKGAEHTFIEALLKLIRGGSAEDITAKSDLNRAYLEKAAELISAPKSYLVIGPSFFENADSKGAGNLLELARESGLIEKGRSRMLLLSAFANAGGVLAAGGTTVMGPGFTDLQDKSGLNRNEVFAAVEKGTLKGIISFGPITAGLHEKGLQYLAAANFSLADSSEADLLFPAQDIESKEGLFVNAAGGACLNQAALKVNDGLSEDWRLIKDFACLMGAKWKYASLEEVRKEMEA